MPQVYSSDGRTRLEWIDAKPVCGRDFCDNCGDCIYCYSDDCCGAGTWILYEGSDDDLIAELKRLEAESDEGDV